MSPRGKKAGQRGAQRPLPVFEPPPGPFASEDVCWLRVRAKGQKKTEYGHRTVRIRMARLADFHEGMRAAGGCNHFARRDSKEGGAINFRCPKSSAPPAESGGAAAAPAPHAVALPIKARAAGGRRTRGPAKPKHAAYGEQRTGCPARYTVSRFGSTTVLVRLLCDEHNHPTDTMATFVSKTVREEIEAEWTKFKTDTPFAALTKNIRARVLRDFCAASGREEAAVLAAWDADEEAPPRDYVLTEKFVRDFCSSLETDATYHKDEGVAVDAWRAANADKVFHFVGGAADDEKHVRRGARLAAPLAAPLLALAAPAEADTPPASRALARSAARQRLLHRPHHAGEPGAPAGVGPQGHRPHGRHRRHQQVEVPPHHAHGHQQGHRARHSGGVGHPQVRGRVRRPRRARRSRQKGGRLRRLERGSPKLLPRVRPHRCLRQGDQGGQGVRVGQRRVRHGRQRTQVHRARRKGYVLPVARAARVAEGLQVRHERHAAQRHVGGAETDAASQGAL
jgi:hypothetical protein